MYTNKPSVLHYPHQLDIIALIFDEFEYGVRTFFVSYSLVSSPGSAFTVQA